MHLNSFIPFFFLLLDPLNFGKDLYPCFLLSALTETFKEVLFCECLQLHSWNTPLPEWIQNTHL